MKNVQSTSIALVEGANVFKQGENVTLGYRAYDGEGNEVDLTGKTLAGSLFGRRGIVYEAPATYTNGVIYFTLADEVVPDGNYQIEFTATSSTDTGYRKKFPTSSADSVFIKKSTDDLGNAGVSPVTVAQFRAEFDQALNALPVDSEINLARVATDGTVYPNLPARLTAEQQATATQLAETLKKNDTGVLSLNAFTESDRAVIQGLEPGQINAVLGVGNVKPLNTVFFNRGTQLFNKAAATSGKRIDSASGNLVDSASFTASEFMPVTPSGTYHKNDDFHHYAWYDSQFNYISGGTSGVIPQRVLNAPANAYYLRVSMSTSSVNVYMLNEGSEPLPHQEYEETFETDWIKRLPVSKVDGKFRKEQVEFVEVGKNKFNKATATAGHFISATTGNMNVNAAYVASDYIPAIPGETYHRSFVHQMAFYDENKNFISGLSSGSVFTVPENARYMRLTLTAGTLDTFQVEFGTEQTAFEDFKWVLKDIETASTGGGSAAVDEVLVYLPPEICIAEGRTIELYNKQVVWAGNIENYHIQWVSTIGKSFKRKWSFSAAAANIGNYDLRINVYDNNMNQVATASTVVKVANATIETPFDIVAVGDSLGNNKPWYGEIRTLSNNAVNFVGTRYNGMSGSLAGQFNEARSGASAANYLSGDYTYTYDAQGAGSENPFWNPATSQFDFDYYKTTYNINPDAVQLFLGTNGMNIDPTENANNIKALVDGIRQSDATIPIFVVNTLYRGDQDGIGNQASNDGYSAARGQWKLEEDRKVFNLMVRLDELLSDYTNLHFVPIALAHDSEFNFGTVETPVNPRNAFTQPQPTEATHPQTAGYMQFADIMFSSYAVHM